MRLHLNIDRRRALTEGTGIGGTNISTHTIQNHQYFHALNFPDCMKKSKILF